MPTLKRRIAIVELAGDRILTDVRITAADTVRYEETATRHKWPTMVVNTKTETGTVPALDHQERFEIWAALRRLDLYAGSWEAFKDGDLVDYAIDEQEVDPTQPAASPDSEPTSP